jgi:hypothetical protein
MEAFWLNLNVFPRQLPSSVHHYLVYKTVENRENKIYSGGVVVPKICYGTQQSYSHEQDTTSSGVPDVFSREVS